MAPDVLLEVKRLSRILLLGHTILDSQLLDALEALRSLGPFQSKLLKETQIGLIVRSVALDPSVSVTVRFTARSLVEKWRTEHRKRSLPVHSDGELMCKALRVSAAECGRATPESGGKDHCVAVPAVPRIDDAPTSCVQMETCTETGASDHTSWKMQSQRTKIRLKLAEIFEAEAASLQSKRAVASPLCSPPDLAVDIESALFRQLAPTSERLYLTQCRSVIFNLKDVANSRFRQNILFGSLRPDHIPQMKADDMASEFRQAAKASVRQQALKEVIDSDPQGDFTCEMCQGTIVRRTLGEIR